MAGYVKTFKIEDKSNKVISFRIDDGKLLEKYKTTLTKIEDLKNTGLNALYIYIYICVCVNLICLLFVNFRKFSENI